MANKRSRGGAVRKSKKSRAVGSGGQGRQALEGRKPTPKAEDRPYHPAAKRAAARERAASTGRSTSAGSAAGSTRGEPRSGRSRDGSQTPEIVAGRNSVLEALRSRIPATALYIAARIDMDDRVKDALELATSRSIAILEVTRPEIDRLAGRDAVHQGIALKVPPYRYAHPVELLDRALGTDGVPLFVAVDGVTDPRNLGAIIRSTAAFGGHGVIVPQRRSAGVTAATWKTSAGAAARLPVAMASNLTQTLKEFKQRGVLVAGLAGDGDTPLPGLPLADRPLVLVVGSEGAGLSRLVTATCDSIVSIPISASTESLNAGIAAAVALYEVARLRAGS